MKLKLIHIALLFFINILVLKSTTIKVIDSETGKPLTSASIYYKIEGNDKFVSILTNKLGEANIPDKKISEIAVKYIGYKTFNIKDFRGQSVIELEQSSIYLGEVVTTGQLVPKSSQESVYNIDVINQEHLESRGAVNLRDVMITEMGINLEQDNILGTGMNINGVSGRNVKILVDGVPVIGRVGGNIDLSQINLNNAERIEVIKGPMSTVYGTDALGGVVNIITKENTVDDINVTANTFYESIGQYNFDAIVGANYNNLVFEINAGRNFFGGFSDPDTSRFKQWKPREQLFLNAQVKKTFDNTSIRYTGNIFNELILNRGNPRPPFGENALDDKYITDRFTNSLFLDTKIKDDMFLNAFVNHSFFNRRKNTYIMDRVTLEETKVPDESYHNDESFDAFQARSTFSHDNPVEYLSYTLGTDINFESGTGERIETGQQSMSDIALFLITQIKPTDKINIQPSIRLIENSNYEAPIIPAINTKFDLGKYTSIRASYSRGFRAPSIKELYFNFFDINHSIQGNTDLEAETSHNYNLSVNFSVEQDKYVFSVEPNVFYNDIDNLITLANVNGDLWENVNIGEFRSLGGGVELNYFRNSLSSRIGFNYIGVYNQFSKEFQADEYLFTPEVQTNIMYDFQSIDARVSIFYKFTGIRQGFELIDEELNQFEIGEFHTLDITANKDIFDDRISLNFGVKNLFNITNIRNGAQLGGGAHSSADGFSTVAWGRTFFTQFQLKVF